MIRTSRFTSCLAGVLLALLPMTAFAEPPTAEDIAAVEHMFGFDQLMTILLDRTYISPKEYGPLDETQLACVKNEAMPVFHAKVDDLFAQLFANREIVAEWVRFAGTGGGGKFLDFLRQGVVAKASDLPAPTDAELDAYLDKGEWAEVDAFLHTPAGSAVVGGMSKLQTFDSPETVAALKLEVKQRCAIKFGDNSTH